MNYSKRIPYFLLASFSLLFFQNCVGSHFDLKNLDETLKKTQAGSTGQPYDGKIFADSSVGANCSDGTFVKSRIVLQNAKSAKIVRENCKDVSRDLTEAEFKLDPTNSDALVYKNQTLAHEQPWTVIPVLASWYYQLTGILQPHNALVYDIDMFSTSPSETLALKQAGHIVICNVSAGTYEPNRPDSNTFNPSDLGNNVSGAAGEKWLDTRSSTVRSIMVARLDFAKTQGCDGVDLDSSDGYANNSGFPLSIQTQVDFNQYLAFAAHDRHLIVALKNVADLAGSLSNAYDFAIADQCFQFNECDKYQSFTAHGKAILSAEFSAFSSSQCNTAQASSLSLSFFNTALDGSRYEPCP